MPESKPFELYPDQKAVVTTEGSVFSRIYFRIFFLIFLFFLSSGGAWAESLPEVLRAWTSLLVKKHPALSALSARIRAQEARISPAGALPDPTLSFVVRNVGDPIPLNTLGEEAMSLTGVRIEQILPWKGKRQTRREIVALEAEGLRVKYRERIWELWKGLVKMTLELMYLEKEAEILREMEEVLLILAETARAKYEAGEGIQADIFKAGTERSLLKERLKRNAERLRVVREGLIRRYLFTRISDLPEIELPERLPPLPARNLLISLLEESPGVSAYKLALRKRQLFARLASLERFPDIKVFAGWYSRGNLPDIYEFGVGFNLPIFISRKQEPLVYAEKEETFSAERTLEDVKAELRYRLEESLAFAETEMELVELYAGEILPQAEADYRSAKYYYETGDLDFLNLLERFRHLLNYRLGLIRHQVNYLTALAEVQALLGREIIRDLPGPKGG